MLEGAVSHSHCTAIPAARRLVNLSGGAMDHEMESDAKALAGVVQEAGAADIHAYGSNKSLTNVVASDGENRWRTALERCVPAIVVLKYGLNDRARTSAHAKSIATSCTRHRVTQNRSFDTEGSSTSYATGFVVDLQRGLILTNRHVITPGAQCLQTVQCQHWCHRTDQRRGNLSQSRRAPCAAALLRSDS